MVGGGKSNRSPSVREVVAVWLLACDDSGDPAGVQVYLEQQAFWLWLSPTVCRPESPGSVTWGVGSPDVPALSISATGPGTRRCDDGVGSEHASVRQFHGGASEGSAAGTPRPSRVGAARPGRRRSWARSHDGAFGPTSPPGAWGDRTAEVTDGGSGKAPVQGVHPRRRQERLQDPEQRRRQRAELTRDDGGRRPDRHPDGPAPDSARSAAIRSSPTSSKPQRHH